jgi:SAM-dependent methyltransferase
MLQTTTQYRDLNLSKANFDSIYCRPDPREYFRVLCGLDYVIPDLARDIFRSLIDHRGAPRGRSTKVLDLGCSYGINAALVRHPLDMQRLRTRYTHPIMQSLTRDELAALDRNFYSGWPAVQDIAFLGLDRSEEAIMYATESGLIDYGLHSDLEQVEPTWREAEQLRDVDLIISTGCVGYIGANTFRRILRTQLGRPVPWVANFVLRMFPYDGIARELEGFGLVTEKLEGVTFVQRRFHSQEEAEATLAALAAEGIDPQGKETDGLLHAELYVSRPAEAVAALPLSQLVSVTSGASRPYGRRYRSAGGELKLI